MDSEIVGDEPTPNQLYFLKAGDIIVTATEPVGHGAWALPPSALCKLSPEQSTFFKAQTGIEDDAALKQHILAVQTKAYKAMLYPGPADEVFPYGCIRSLSFLQLAITALSVYENILALGRERPNAIFLDVGACFGVDGRKAAADGFPLRNIVNFDLQREFFDLGHDLFKTTPASYPVNFIAGDVLDIKILKIVPPFEEAVSTETPDLSTLTSLNQLAGHCSVIHVSRFFHLFSEGKQHYLARALAGLLSPQSGSIICGQHVGDAEKRIVHREYRGISSAMFCHSPQSWTDLWDGEVFTKGTVEVSAYLVWTETDEGPAYWLMRWSVVRL